MDLHRPHPPGYIGYVAFGKLISSFTGSPESALVLLSILASSASVVVMYLVARRYGGELNGITAALLLMVSPLAWVYAEGGVTNEFDILLSIGAGGLALATIDKPSRCLGWLALVVGLSGAVRATTEGFLLPLYALLTVVLLRRKAVGAGRIAAASGTLILATAGWLIPSAISAGGFGRYVAITADLNIAIDSRLSAVWFTGLPGLIHNVGAVIDGLVLGVGAALAFALIAMISAVLHRERMEVERWSGLHTWVVLMWTVPAILEFSLYHIGHLAYVLFLLPPALFFSGSSFRYLARRYFHRAGPAATLTAIGICVLIETYATLSPTSGLMQNVSGHDQGVAAILASVSEYPPETTALVAAAEGPDTYRILLYYEPQYRIVGLLSDTYGRAGELYSNRAGYPELDIRRLNNPGPIYLPAGITTWLVADPGVVDLIADRQWLTQRELNGREFWTATVMSSDPPRAVGSRIYLRASDGA